jgi:hypothetical protein
MAKRAIPGHFSPMVIRQKDVISANMQKTRAFSACFTIRQQSQKSDARPSPIN